MTQSQPDPFTVIVRNTAELSNGELLQIKRLFDETYDQADFTYIDTTTKTLSHVALTYTGLELIGFSFAETRLVQLPGFEAPTAIALAGISCVAPKARKHGLFARMTQSALSATGNLVNDRAYLFCGRMAHALSYRTIKNVAQSCVPSAGKEISDWQQSVLSKVAEQFNVKVDPNTGLVRGSGRPIGAPRVSFTTTEEEARLFEQVDRSRGDSLLTIAWIPDAPQGW